MSIINLYLSGLIGFIIFVLSNILIFKFKLKNPFLFTISIFLIIFILIIIIKISDNLDIILSSLVIYFFLCIFYTIFLLGLNNSVSVKLIVRLIKIKELNKNIFYNDYVYEKSFKNRLKYLEDNNFIFNKSNFLNLTDKSKRILKIYNILVKIFLKNINTG